MYLNSGETLFAVDGATGRTLWTASAPAEFPGGGRGPASGDGRIYATGRSMIAAFDAADGTPIESFGNGGLVSPARAALDFKDPDRYPPDFDPESIGYLIAASPTYADGTLFVGLAVSENVIPGGLVAALDAVTGTVKWVFRTIPQGPGDDGWELTKDTWSEPERYGGGIWSPPAVDPALNMVYVNRVESDAELRRLVTQGFESLHQLHRRARCHDGEAAVVFFRPSTTTFGTGTS